MYDMNQFAGMPKNYHAKIRQLIGIVTRPAPAMVKRDVTTHINNAQMNGIMNVVDKSINQNVSINPTAINQVAPNIMSLSDVPVAPVNIANGWNTERLQILLSVVFWEQSDPNTQYYVYVQGYTDYNDLSASGLSDPNMTIFINNITRSTKTLNVASHNYSNMIVDSAAMLHNNGNMMEVNDRTLRPSDILTNIITNDTYGDTNIIHADSAYDNTPKMSKRDNNFGVMHFSKVLSKYVEADHIANSWGDAGPNDVFANASNILTDPTLNGNLFIERLGAINGHMMLNSFKLSDLEKIDPSATLQVVERGQVIRTTQTQLDTDVTESLANADIKSRIANEIANSVLMLLSNNMLSSISFTSTNITGENIVAITHGQSFIDTDDNAMRSGFNSFTAMWSNIIMPSLTQNNLFVVDMLVDASVFGDVTVALIVNGQGPTTYRIPAYCDSLFSPMVANTANADKVINDYSTILKSLN